MSLKGLAQTPSCSAASKFYSKDSIIITTFGASTVAGVNGYSFQPYLQANFKYCYVGKAIVVTNYGIAGQTTTQGLARFQSAITGKTGFVCILMGVNDALNLVSGSKPATAAQVTKALAITQSNMEDMVQMALSNNLVPIIGTIQYVNDRNLAAYKTANSYIKRINAGYIKLVSKYKGKVYLADINAALGYDFTLFQADGLHPNDKGDKVISYVWFDAINEAIENKLLLIGLDQNYPNPARTKTTIGFSLSQSGNVNIQLYNMLGLPLKTLANEFYNSGYHQLDVTLNDLKPGMYIYVMKIAGRQLTKKMIVVN
ncbi:GDSL-type esterase/lipase family protein [Mucilaginibacter gracilis]|uniref:GDSL-type esterase/lipase family protein n=1 Tax=Mucilaginibacter gracilis TaxID=423350 RepID=UPI0013C2DDBB|nr:GDSL-type esterase/lipase family protein [Mucilaginibacter gracilis]